MQQLELFAPVSKTDLSKEQMPPQKEADKRSVFASNDSLTETLPVEILHAATASQNLSSPEHSPQNNFILPQVPAINEVVFSDGKISVKIKQKKADGKAAPAETPKAIKPPQKRGRKPLKETENEFELIEVPEDEELYKKQYYSISVVAKWFNVNTSLLRFWENEFDILKPRKNRKGDRLFRPEDVKNLQLIHHLLRQRKYSIEGAKEFLKGNKEKADVELQLTLSLQKFKSFLLELKANLQS